MSDTWKHAGDEAAKIRERFEQMRAPAVPGNVVPFEDRRKARLAELSHECDWRRRRVQEIGEEARKLLAETKFYMTEMERLSPNYAGEYVKLVRREEGDGAA